MSIRRRTVLGWTAAAVGGYTVPLLGFAAEDRPLRLGLIWSDTGPAAAFGKIHREASTLALEQLNEAGGVNGMPVEYHQLDDRSDPTVGINAAKRLITRNKVDAIVGSSASLVTIAFSKVCQDNKVPLVNGMAGSPGVTGQGFNYTWRVILNNNLDCEQMAQILVEKHNKKSFAFLAENSDYGKGPSEAFANKVRELGATVTAYEVENRGDTDFRAQLTKIKATDPEVIYVHAYYAEGGIIARQIRELNWPVQVVVNAGLGIPEFSKLAGDAAKGVLFPLGWSPLYDDEKSVAFTDAYMKRWGHQPASSMEAGSYDAIWTVAEAVKLGGGVDSARIQQGLEKMNDAHFLITLGVIDFDDTNQNHYPIKVGVFDDEGNPVPSEA